MQLPNSPFVYLPVVLLASDNTRDFDLARSFYVLLPFNRLTRSRSVARPFLVYIIYTMCQY